MHTTVTRLGYVEICFEMTIVLDQTHEMPLFFNL